MKYLQVYQSLKSTTKQFTPSKLGILQGIRFLIMVFKSQDGAPLRGKCEHQVALKFHSTGSETSCHPWWDTRASLPLESLEDPLYTSCNPCWRACLTTKAAGWLLSLLCILSKCLVTWRNDSSNYTRIWDCESVSNESAHGKPLE